MAMFTSVRQSPGLVILVVFVALMLDVMLMTCVDPILPDMLREIYKHHVTYIQNVTSLSQNGSDKIEAEVEDGRWSINVQLGIMVAAKPATEMISNIAVGLLVDRVGHRWPMTLGFLFNVFATVGFAYSPSYTLLLVTRVAQAIGSSLSVVAGLAFLASVFTNDEDRGRATGRAFGGVSIGIILGYPFGSIVYDLCGRQAPFLILAAVSLLDGLLRLALVAPASPNKTSVTDLDQKKHLHPCNLLCDRLIWVCLGCVFVQHCGLGMFLATGPAWMINDLGAQQWSIGTVLGVCVIFHLIAQLSVGELGLTKNRWIALWIGLVIISIGTAVYPLCRSIWYVIGPEITVRIGHGIALCVLSPLLAHLVDVRHGGGSYGAVYGLYTMFYNLGLTVGPIVGGILMNHMSFDRLYWGTAGIILLYSILCLCLKPEKRTVIYDAHHVKSGLLKSTSDYGSIEES